MRISKCKEGVKCQSPKVNNAKMAKRCEEHIHIYSAVRVLVRMKLLLFADNQQLYYSFISVRNHKN